MKELTVFEMDAISGAGFFDDLAGGVEFLIQEAGAVALGAAVGATMAGAWGGRWGAAGGGLIGVGAIGQGVGLIAGLLVGGIGFGITGGLIGWDKTHELATGTIQAVIDGKLEFWS